MENNLSNSDKICEWLNIFENFQPNLWEIRQSHYFRVTKPLVLVHVLGRTMEYGEWRTQTPWDATPKTFPLSLIYKNFPFKSLPVFKQKCVLEVKHLGQFTGIPYKE